MPIPKTEPELIQAFTQLGAKDPEGWAKSQLSEGIPQILRFMFLKRAWESVPGDLNASWVTEAIESSQSSPDGPYAGFGKALAACLDRGVSQSDIVEIVRCAKASMLFDIAYLLEAPEPFDGSLSDVEWGLFQVDEDGNPIGRQIAGLHESVLEMDPTGREMRPKKVP
jgi:hypothetical protein